MWYIDNLGSADAQEIRTRTNFVFMLNAKNPTSTSAECNVLTTNNNTKIKLVSLGGDTYRIQLNSTSNRYLTAAGTTSGSKVYWQALNSSANTQKWKIVKLATQPYPKYPTDYSYAYVTSGSIPFYLITVDAAKIGVVNVLEQNVGIPVPYCGCNGGWFDNKALTGSSHNIALNYGVPVGPYFNSKDFGRVLAGSYNTVGSWNIAYCGGEIKFVQAKNLDELKTALGGVTPIWAQGGISLDFGSSKWEDDWDSERYKPDNLSTGRTMVVANKASKKVYLFVQRTETAYSIRAFRETVRNYLGIPQPGFTSFVGLVLDGGISSGLRCYNSAGSRVGADASRALDQIIYIKPE